MWICWNIHSCKYKSWIFQTGKMPKPFLNKQNYFCWWSINQGHEVSSNWLLLTFLISVKAARLYSGFSTGTVQQYCVLCILQEVGYNNEIKNGAYIILLSRYINIHIKNEIDAWCLLFTFWIAFKIIGWGGGGGVVSLSVYSFCHMPCLKNKTKT